MLIEAHKNIPYLVLEESIKLYEPYNKKPIKEKEQKGTKTKETKTSRGNKRCYWVVYLLMSRLAINARVITMAFSLFFLSLQLNIVLFYRNCTQHSPMSLSLSLFLPPFPEPAFSATIAPRLSTPPFVRLSPMPGPPPRSPTPRSGSWRVSGSATRPAKPRLGVSSPRPNVKRIRLHSPTWYSIFKGKLRSLYC